MKKTLRVNGPNASWTLTVDHWVATRVLGEFRNQKPIRIDIQDDGPFGKGVKEYHFNPVMLVGIEVLEVG